MQVNRKSTDELLSDIVQHTRALEEHIQRFFDLLQGGWSGLVLLLLFSFATAMAISFSEYLLRPMEFWLKVFIYIGLIIGNSLVTIIVIKTTIQVRSGVRTESIYCRRIVTRASEILEQRRLSKEERVEVEAAVQEAEQAIKLAERTLLIGPRFARRYM